MLRESKQVSPAPYSSGAWFPCKLQSAKLCAALCAAMPFSDTLCPMRVVPQNQKSVTTKQLSFSALASVWHGKGHLIKMSDSKSQSTAIDGWQTGIAQLTNPPKKLSPSSCPRPTGHHWPVLAECLGVLFLAGVAKGGASHGHVVPALLGRFMMELCWHDIHLKQVHRMDPQTKEPRSCNEAKNSIKPNGKSAVQHGGLVNPNP